MLQWLCVLLVSVSAQATDRAGQVGVGGTLGFVHEAPWATAPYRHAVSIGPRVSVFGRWQHLTYSGLELGLDYFSHSKSDLSVKAIRGTYLFRFLPESSWHPVFGVGFGLAKTNSYFQSGNVDMALYHLRLAVEKELRENIDLSFQLDHFSIFRNLPTEPNLHDLSPSVSLVYHFGKPSPTAVAAAPTAPTGSPANVVDTDGDGVADGEDRCPNTPVGTKVNALGCAEKQSFEIRLDVKFRSSTAELTKDSEAGLVELAGILKAFPEVRVELQGHTDSSGTSARNRTLSQARAQAVKSRLQTAHGIAASRLEAKGYGSSQPLERETDAASRAKNRRVTAKVLR